MQIAMLYENKASTAGLCSGHGLSIHIQANGLRILFDVGPNNDFLKNAKRLGVDIAEVDLCVLSHGHYDHGGGLQYFLEHNQKSKVYIGAGAFGDYYYQNPESLDYIGLDKNLTDNPRIVTNPNYTHPAEGVELFSLPSGSPRVLQGTLGHLIKKREGDNYLQDDFAHEQSMVVNEGGRRLLVSGCSHTGIVNIIDEAEKLCSAPMDVVMGGFHLSDPDTGRPEDSALLAEIAQSLAKRPTRYYCFHCTGHAAYVEMKQVLGGRLETLHGGDRFTL